MGDQSTGFRIRDAAAFQVQSSRDGSTWIPRQPAPDGIGTMRHGGDYWFTDHHQAWVAANTLRNALTWSEVRVIAKGHNGDIVGEQVIL
ncbi:hypothetical protein BJF79_03335 [Actinomadura sp. CNU-125]|uniref:hypothetical protein n=1 Tax=Actinomadura sp. CNU-125 TaxID=1904961 RepID=UPI00095C5DC5|nr:hypothetical protein [Actinomadura sp. CNU-125]OLT12946.1 hypothetical protein BJF79_03335 [Actinomadura sp. CNU-125]